MPELPEVETIRRDLNRLIVGRKIIDITTDSAKQVKPSLAVVKRAIAGKTILRVGRRAKALVICLSGGSDGGTDHRGHGRQSPSSSKILMSSMTDRASEKTICSEGTENFLAVHLKMTGRLLVRKKSDPVDDYQRVIISLSGGKELRFCDLRKFGWIRVIREIGEIGEMGVEPLTREFTKEKLREILGRTGRAVKIVLMDQKKIAGVGNIYANEALFLAKIRPDKAAKELSNKQVKKLHQAIEEVLKTGIKYRGASDQHYLDALGRKGRYQEHFLVYRRDGEKCFDCGGEIKRLRLGGRGSFYCPECQK